MATFDFRILLETVEGKKTSYMSQSFVDTSVDLVLSASQVYHRITGSVSCSYQNSPTFTGTFNPKKKFKNNLLLSSSLSGSLNTGSINFESMDTEYDRLLRYKFFGEKVCSTLGLPTNQWIYVDQVRLPADEEANIFQGNIDGGNIFVADTLTFANNSNINSDVPFLINTGSDRHIKFIDERGFSTLGLIMGYDKDLDTYEISGSNEISFSIGGVNKLVFADGTEQSTAGGGGGSDNLGNHTATQDLDLDGNDIFDVQHITASGNISASGDTHRFGGFIQFDNNKGINVKTTAGTYENLIYGTSGDDIYYGSNGSGAFKSHFFRTYQNSNILHLTSSGGGNTSRVGVNKQNPTKTLEVAGDISASGFLQIDEWIQTDSHITASGDISSSGVVYGNSYYVGNKLLAINDGSQIIFGSTTYPNNFAGNITASGDISSSGDLYADGINIGGNVALTDSGTELYLGNDNTWTNINYGRQSTDTHTFNGNIVGDNSTNISGINHITASGNISSSGDIYGTDIFLTEDASPTITLTDTTNNYSLVIQQANSDAYIGFDDDANQNLKFDSNADGNHMFLDGGTGFTGLGTNAPTKKLQVAGDISASDDVYIGTDVEVGRHGFFAGNVTVNTQTADVTGLTVAGDISASGNLFIEGSISASAINTTIVSSSILFTSGSNIFGDASTDTHTFQGNITASGQISASGTGTHYFGGVIVSTANRIYPNGTDNAFLRAENGQLQSSTGFTGVHITASGNISSSGTITAEQITSTDDMTVTDDLTVGGDISASGGNHTFGGTTVMNVLKTSSIIKNTNPIQISPDAFTILANPTALLNVLGDIKTTSHISASGDISSSANLYASVLHSNNWNAIGNSVTIGNDATFAGAVTASSDITASGNIYGGKIYSNDEIYLRDGGVGGDTLVKLHNSSDDGIISVYSNNTEKIRLNGNPGQITASSHIVTTTGDIISMLGNISGSVTSTGSFGFGYFDGKVGIGTTSPGQVLEVVGNISASGQLIAASANFNDGNISNVGEIAVDKVVADAGAATFMSFAGGAIKTEAGDVILNDGGDDVHFQVKAAGDDNLIYANYGNNECVGIGTEADGGSKFQVGGSIKTIGASGHITASGNISASGQLRGSNVKTTIISAISDTIVFDDGATTLASPKSLVSVVGDMTVSSHITASGNISASGDLLVGGDISGSESSTGSFGQIRVGSQNGIIRLGSALNAVEISTNLEVGGITTTGDVTVGGANLHIGPDDSVQWELMSHNSGLLFRSASTATYLNITDEGNVQIGKASTADSGEKLQVEGKISASSLTIDDITIDGSKISDASGLEIEAGANFHLDGGGEILLDSATSQITVLGNITASNDISASGTIAMLTASIGGGIFTSASLAAGGGGVSFPTTEVISSSAHIHTLSHITASGNISASGNMIAAQGRFSSRVITPQFSEFTTGAGHLFNNNITASGEISSSIVNTGTVRLGNTAGSNYLRYDGVGFFYKGSGKFSSHITASGNISASGTITSSGFNLIGTGTAELEVDGHITASGNISASGNIIGDFPDTNDDALHYPLVTDGNTIERVNDFSINPSTAVVAFGNQINVNNHIFLNGAGGHITASGNISSSGIISASEFGPISSSGFIKGSSLDINGAADISGNLTLSTGNLQLTSGVLTLVSTPEIYAGVVKALTLSSTGTIVNGNLSASGYISTESHITASGNISSSGAISAKAADGFFWGTDATTAIYSDGTNSVTVKTNDEDTFQIGTYGVNVPFGNVTASGNISSSGNYIGNREFSVTNNVDASYQGDVVYFGSTTGMDNGKIYAYGGDGKWHLSDADNNNLSGSGLLGVALGTNSSGSGVLLRGMVTLDHDPGAVGDVLYLSTTAGQATSTPTSGSADIIRVIGYCLDASNGQIWFNPSSTFVEAT